MERWPPLSPETLEGHKWAIENDVRAPQLAENMDVIVFGSENVVPTVSPVRIRGDTPHIMLIFKNSHKTSQVCLKRATPVYLLFNFQELEEKSGENVNYLLGLDNADIVAKEYVNNTIRPTREPNDGITTNKNVGNYEKQMIHNVNYEHSDLTADKKHAEGTESNGVDAGAETSNFFETIPAAVVSKKDRRAALDLKLKDRSDIAEDIKTVLRRHSNVFACFKVIRATENTRKKGGAGLATNHSHVKQNVTAARGRCC